MPSEASSQTIKYQARRTKSPMSIIRGWRRFDKKYLMPFFIRTGDPKVDEIHLLSKNISFTVKIMDFIYSIPRNTHFNFYFFNCTFLIELFMVILRKITAFLKISIMKQLTKLTFLLSINQVKLLF